MRIAVAVVLGLLACSLPATADEGGTKVSKVVSALSAQKATDGVVAKSAATSTAKPGTAKAGAAKAKAKDPLRESVRRVLQRPAPRSLSEARRRMASIKVDIDFRGMDAVDAIEFIGRMAGFNVILGPEVQREGLDALPQITLKLRKASLRTVADLVARFTRTKMMLTGGILSFTTPEAARGKPVLRIYAIGELTFVLRNFPGPDMNLRPSGAEFEMEEQTDVENPFSDPERVVDMLKEFVASKTWEDESVSIWADERKLVVRQYPAVQRKIARFLMLLNASR